MFPIAARSNVLQSLKLIILIVHMRNLGAVDDFDTFISSEKLEIRHCTHRLWRAEPILVVSHSSSGVLVRGRSSPFRGHG